MTPEKLLDILISGRIPDFGKQHGYLRCDACFADIHAPAHVGIYASTMSTEGTDTPFRLHMTFCSDCRPSELPVPTRGVTEVLLHTRVVDEGGLPKLVDPEVAATSKEDEGFDWDYAAVWETLTDIPLEEMQMNGSAVTPAHVWGVLRAFGVDVPSLLDDEGEYDVEADREAELQQQVSESVLELASKMG